MNYFYIEKSQVKLFLSPLYVGFFDLHMAQEWMPF